MPENDEHKPAFTFADNPPSVMHVAMTTAVTACNRWVERDGVLVLQYATTFTSIHDSNTGRLLEGYFGGWRDVHRVAPDQEDWHINAKHELEKPST